MANTQTEPPGGSTSTGAESDIYSVVSMLQWPSGWRSIGHGLPLILQCQVNSALHLFGVSTLLTSFGCGKVGNATSAGWQVTLCDPIWHVSSCSGEAGLLTKGEPLHRVYF